ncbi:MAG: condensation domain-containing protein, partial [Ginsengibacter sp.]
MKAIDILYLAKQGGIDISLNGEQLQLKVPENKIIDDTLLQQVRDNKQLIIDYLSNSIWKSNSVNNNYQKIQKVDKNLIDKIPLSFSQERLWFIHQLEGSMQYHASEVLWLNGNLNKNALEHALQMVVNRHEVLRTIIKEEGGQTFQQIKQKDSWQLHIIDGSHYQNNKKLLQKDIDELINKPFNLSKDDMMRVYLITLNVHEQLLVITFHHIAYDGWSRPILVKEIAELYASFLENRFPVLPALALQYSDYAMWQRQYLQGDILDAKISYWKEKLQGVTSLQMPTDFKRPAVQTAKGTSITFTIDKDLSNNIKQLSKQQEATLFMTLLSAFKVLLFHYSGQQDICVGTSIADRKQEVENLIGFFVNTLALRSEVKANATFIELLQQVKTTTLQAYQHQEAP